MLPPPLVPYTSRRCRRVGVSRVRVRGVEMQGNKALGKEARAEGDQRHGAAATGEVGGRGARAGSAVTRAGGRRWG